MSLRWRHLRPYNVNFYQVYRNGLKRYAWHRPTKHSMLPYTA